MAGLAAKTAAKPAAKATKPAEKARVAPKALAQLQPPVKTHTPSKLRRRAHGQAPVFVSAEDQEARNALRRFFTKKFENERKSAAAAGDAPKAPAKPRAAKRSAAKPSRTTRAVEAASKTATEAGATVSRAATTTKRTAKRATGTARKSLARSEEHTSELQSH